MPALSVSVWQKSVPQKARNDRRTARSSGREACEGEGVIMPASLIRFLDTLGIADDLPWRPQHEGQEPPF
jgi:hypothetical protein